MLVALPDRLLHWDVLTMHLDEAAFLSAQWEQALRASTDTLVEVEQGVEQRLQAHVEALTLGGPRVAAHLLLPVLTHAEDQEYVRVAGLALLGSGAQAHVEAVLQAFCEGSPSLRESSQWALRLGWDKERTRQLWPLLATAEPSLRAAALEVLRFHRVHPGARLLEWMDEAEVPALQAATLRLACSLPADAMAEDKVRYFLSAPEPEVREAALILGLTCGMRMAWCECERAAAGEHALGRTARLLLALGGGPAEVDRLKELLQVPALRADVLWSLGFSGRPAAAVACLPWMHTEAVAGVAAEAFCAITGLRLEGPLARERDTEEPQELSPLDVDLEQDLGLSGEPPVLPNATAVEAWWAKAQEGFEPAGRYWGGKPFSTTSLLEALAEAPMHRRPPLALELAIRSQGRCQLEVRTWARLQRQQLNAVRSAPPRLNMQPFSAWMKR